jgi:hypothetical protein
MDEEEYGHGQALAYKQRLSSFFYEHYSGFTFSQRAQA